MSFWAVMVDRCPYFLSLLLKGAVMTVTVAVGALLLRAGLRTDRRARPHVAVAPRWAGSAMSTPSSCAARRRLSSCS